MKKFLFDKRGITKMQAMILAAVIIVAAVAAGVYYVVTRGTTPAKTIIGVIVPSSELEDCVDYIAGVRQAMNQLAPDQFELRWAASSYDVAVDITNLNSLIAAGAKLVVGYGGGTAWLRPALEAIRDNNIYFSETFHLLPDYAPWNSEWDPYWVNFNIADDRTGMYEITQLLCEHLDGHGNIAFIPGPPGTVPAEGRAYGVRKAAAEYPNITLIEGAPALKWSQEEGHKNMEDLLTTHPNIDACVGICDSTALGMRDAAIAHGLGILPTIGMDGTRSALTEIAAGRYYATLAHTIAYMGGLSLVKTFDAWKGVQLTHEERATFGRTTIVTNDDVDSLVPFHTCGTMKPGPFYDDMYGAGFKLRDGFAWDFRKMSKYYAQQEGFNVDYSGGVSAYGGTQGPIDMTEFYAWMRSIGIT